MTTAHDIDWPQVLADRLTTCYPDVLRELLATFIHTVLGAEAAEMMPAQIPDRGAVHRCQKNAQVAASSEHHATGYRRNELSIDCERADHSRRGRSSLMRCGSGRQHQIQSYPLLGQALLSASCLRLSS